MGPLSQVVKDALDRLAAELERYEDIAEMPPEEAKAALADMIHARRGLLGAARVLGKLVRPKPRQIWNAIKGFGSKGW